MPEPEYILKPDKVPSIANSVLIEIQTTPVPQSRRLDLKKSGQKVFRVHANDARSLIEEYRSSHSNNRLFVRGIDETPELAALHKKRLEHFKNLVE